MRYLFTLTRIAVFFLSVLFYRQLLSSYSMPQLPSRFRLYGWMVVGFGAEACRIPTFVKPRASHRLS